MYIKKGRRKEREVQLCASPMVAKRIKFLCYLFVNRGIKDKQLFMSALFALVCKYLHYRGAYMAGSPDTVA